MSCPRRKSIALWLRFMLLCAAVLSLGLPTARAQYRTSIQGTVTDPQGAVVPGATLTLTDMATNAKFVQTSDPVGIYNFNALPAGSHFTLTVEKDGFTRKVLNDLRLIPEQANSLNIQLEVGTSAQTVTVNANETPALDTQTASTSGTITSREITSLPSSGRNVFMLLQLAPGITGDNSQGAGGNGNNLPGSAGPGNPGVAPGVNSGIFATENGPQIVAGGLGYQHNSISLDGISTVSAVWGGTSVVTPSEESVSEVKVISNSYDAENGRFAGAQVQVITKSGGNQPHGSFFSTFHRPGLDAYQSWNGTGGKKLRDDNFFTQLGGSLGAPIWKNKLFGFFSWESSRSPAVLATQGTAWMETPDFQALASSGSIASKYLSWPGSIPSNPSVHDISCADAGFNSSNCIQIPGKGLNIGSPLKTGLGTQDTGWVSSSNPGVGGGLNANGPADIAQYNIVNHRTGVSFNQYIGRVDANLTQNDRLSGSIYWIPQSYTNLGTRAYDLSHHTQTSNALSVIWDHTFSPTFLNEVRANAAGWRWNEIKSNPQMPYGLPADSVSGMPVSLVQYGPQIGSDLNQWTYTYKDVATKILNRHTIKFGGELTRLYYLQACYGCALPSYSFYNIWDFLNDAPNSESANVNPALGTPTPGRQDQRENLFGIFVQDDYKLRPNLTVNLGLRWSYFGPLYSKENNMFRAVPGAGTAFLTGLTVVKGNSWGAQKNDFSPEIGFAWLPNRFNGKLVLRGGFGIGYNQEEIAISANISSNPGLTVGQSLSSGGPTSINPNIVYAPASDLHSFNYPANPAFKTTLGSNGLPTTGSAQLFIFPRNLPTTREEHYSVDAQYQFGNQWIASLGYQGSNSHNIIANAQINPYAAANGYALNPAIAGDGWANYWNASGYGNYSAIFAELKRNLSHGLMFDVQFNWQRNMDTNTGPYTEEVYPYSASLNYAPSDNNIPREWKIWGSYAPKFFAGKPAWMEKTMGGWTLTGIYDIHNGFPWTPQYNLQGGGSLYCGTCWYNNVLPVAMSGAGNSKSNSAYETGSNFGGQAPVAKHLSYFTLPTYTKYTGSFYGNANPQAGMKRNWITGPGYRSMDASLSKDFGLPTMPVVGEAARLQVRMDAYNLFNNLNLTGGNGGIDRTINDNNFGRSNGALGARVVTLGARFDF
ncbi:MAG TPA: TonB-dependent receptor [Terracidiphilus sp.]|nr:TonB-dependent receptor [Terracidiphilus sp.]